MIRKKDAESLDALVRQALRNLGLEERFEEQQVIDLWAEVVGQTIASRTKELFMNRGTLYVRFTSAVVKNEVRMVLDGLKDALNKKIGKPIVREIILK